MDWLNIVLENKERLVEYRRYLHTNPELSGKEYNTLQFIKDKLEEYDIDYIHIPHGGVLAILDTNKPGKTVLLRADIDALPIQEAPVNNGGFKKQCVSNIDGISHTCGHDGHTSMLLVACQIMKTHIQQFKGKIYCVFEQGEEANGNIFHILNYFNDHNITYDYAFGIHNGAFNYFDTGTILIPQGDFYAGMKHFVCQIIGKGGHGSRPDLANNPMDSFVDFYHELTNYDIDSITNGKKLSYSIGKLLAGNKANIIPDTLDFEGTIRFYDQQIGDQFENLLKELLKKSCDKHQTSFTYKNETLAGLPITNNKEFSIFASNVLSKYMNIDACQPKMSSESYSLYMQFAPSIYTNLVTNNKEKGMTAGVHTSVYEFDEDMMYLGTLAHIVVSESLLKEEPTFSFKQENDFDNLMKRCNVDLDKIL